MHRCRQQVKGHPRLRHLFVV